MIINLIPLVFNLFLPCTFSSSFHTPFIPTFFPIKLSTLKKIHKLFKRINNTSINHSIFPFFMFSFSTNHFFLFMPYYFHLLSFKLDFDYRLIHLMSIPSCFTVRFSLNTLNLTSKEIIHFSM